MEEKLLTMDENSGLICIASDHAGFPMKQFLKQKLSDSGYVVKDYGCYSEQSVDYPDYIHPLAKSVDQGECERGIIICGSGNGAQMTANKYPNVRAALCWDAEQTRLARMHNDANVMSLPGRFVEFEESWRMTMIFLQTEFEGGRHTQRVEKISRIQ